MKNILLIFAMCIGLFTFLSAAPAIPEQFPGTYRFAGDADEVKEFNQAVNGFIHQIPFFVRSFYSSGIRSGFNLPEEIKIIHNEDGLISIDASLKSTVFSDLNKTPVIYVNPDGKKTELQRKMIDFTIREKFTDDRGIRLNSYEFSSNGRKMIYSVKFTNKRLRNPLTFQLSFEKTDMISNPEKK